MGANIYKGGYSHPFRGCKFACGVIIRDTKCNLTCVSYLLTAPCILRYDDGPVIVFYDDDDDDDDDGGHGYGIIGG